MKTRKLLTVASLGILLASTSSLAQEVSKEQIDALQAQIKALQEQVNLLQRKQEVAEEIKTNDQQKFASVEYGKKGLAITSPDKQYQLKIKGFAQADSRTYHDDKTNPGNADQFLLRTTRLTLDTKLPSGFSTRITNDFSSSTLIDAYADWTQSPYFSLRAGKSKAPVGLERWQSETDTAFIERGLTTNLVPNRDIGFGAYGELIPGSLEYQVAVQNGAPDLVVGSTDTSGGKDFVGRIFAQPFKNSDIADLQGLGIGIAGSIGQKDGSTAAGNSELTAGYKTTAQNNFFTFTPAAGTVFANGKNTRINPQAWYYNGPFSLLGEYVKEEIEVSKSTAPSTVTSLTNDAWTAIATYVLTGEDAAFDGVKPAQDFNPEKGNWGAFELAARLGELDIDDNAFPTFANLSSSASKIEEKIFGLNWYLNQNLRLSFDYANNTFEGGATGGADRPDEDVFLARVQFKF